jgi:hypothetical protein
VPITYSGKSMDMLAEKLDAKLREWKPNIVAEVKQRIREGLYNPCITFIFAYSVHSCYTFYRGDTMKIKTLFALITLLVFVQPAFAALTPDDIQIIREEVTKIVKEQNDTLEKRLREYVDLKFEVLDTKFTTKFEALDTKVTTLFGEVDKRLTYILILVTSLIALIVLAIGIPQIIITLKQKDQGALEAEIKTLREKIEHLEQTRLIGPH